MSDRGIGEKAFDIALQQGQGVADDHRCRRQRPEQQLDVLQAQGAELMHEPEQESEDGAFRYGGHIGGDRRRRSLVHVGNPEMKRYEA